MNGLLSILAFTLLLKVSYCQKNKKYCSSINGNKPPKSSNCWTWNPVDQTTNLRTGCDHTKCETAVCKCDPYCCETSWDLACVGYSSTGENGFSNSNQKDNPFSNGCSAHTLCCGGDDSVDLVGNQVYCNSTTAMVGYDDIDALNEDIATLDIETYVICPNTIFTLNLTSNGILPIQNTTRIQCGKDGSSVNNCTITGGNSHVLFDYSVIVMDVVFHGITFTQSVGASLSAWGPSSSYASFLDCHWINNLGYDTVDILYQESTFRRRLLEDNQAIFQSITKDNQLDIHHLRTHRDGRKIQENQQNSMTIVFNDCSFVSNRQNIGVILNVGGIVQLIKCRFESNVVSVSLSLLFYIY